MRFLVLVFAFVMTEAVLLVEFKDRAIDYFGRNWPASIQSSVHRDALSSVQVISAANESQRPHYFVMGPSNARAFYRAITRDLGEGQSDVLQVVSGSQVLPDALRLIDHIDVPGSTVVFVFSAYKLATMAFAHTMIETHYLSGIGGKYMMSSPAFDMAWKDFKTDRDVTTNTWTSEHWRLFQPFMPYAYYFNDAVDENIKRPIARMANTLRMQKTLIAATAPPPNEIDPIYNPLPIRLLQEFRSRRDYAKPLFKESVDESFKILDRLVTLAKAKGIRFIAVEAPFPKLLERELLPDLPDYDAGLRVLATAHPDLRIIRLDRTKWDNGQALFSDYVHLSNDGETYYHDYLVSPFRDDFVNKKQNQW